MGLGTMKALRKLEEGVGHVELGEVPIPEIGPDEVLMKVWAAGVCGSDLLIQEDRHFYRAPVTLGHEYSGVAYQVGKEVTRVKEGDKFVADIECGEGQWLGVTIDGAYAPYMRVPEHVIYRIPDHVSLDHACLAEPIVATHHLIQERAQVKVGDDVVIVGPGPMGIMGVLYAKVCGARRVFLIGLKSDEKRLQDRQGVWRRPCALFRGRPREGGDGHHRWQGRRVRARVLGQPGGRAARHRLRPQSL